MLWWFGIGCRRNASKWCAVSTSVSASIHWGTIGVVENIHCLSLEDLLNNIVPPCAVGGFRIVVIMVETKFKSLKDMHIVDIWFNVVLREEGLDLIEIWYMVVKEWGRCYYAILWFDHLSRKISIHLMINVVFMWVILHGKNVCLRQFYHYLLLKMCHYILSCILGWFMAIFYRHMREPITQWSTTPWMLHNWSK